MATTSGWRRSVASATVPSVTDFHPCSQQHYFRVTAYRVEPYKNNGCFSVDGEGYPFEPFQVECHRGMATVLSPSGCYEAEFHLPEDTPKK